MADPITGAAMLRRQMYLYADQRASEAARTRRLANARKRAGNPDNFWLELHHDADRFRNEQPRTAKLEARLADYLAKALRRFVRDDGSRPEIIPDAWKLQDLARLIIATSYPDNVRRNTGSDAAEFPLLHTRVSLRAWRTLEAGVASLGARGKLRDLLGLKTVLEEDLERARADGRSDEVVREDRWMLERVEARIRELEERGPGGKRGPARTKNPAARKRQELAIVSAWTGSGDQAACDDRVRRSHQFPKLRAALLREANVALGSPMSRRALQAIQGQVFDPAPRFARTLARNFLDAIERRGRRQARSLVGRSPRSSSTSSASGMSSVNAF